MQPIIIGQKYGRWTVLGVAERRADHHYSVCQCDCGKISEVRNSCLNSGTSLSCGCISREVTSARSIKHNYYGTPIYRIWIGMVQRTTDMNAPNWHNYGGMD